MRLKDERKTSVNCKNLNYQEFRKILPQLIEIYLSAYEKYPQYAYTNPRRVKSYLHWLYKGDPHGFFVAFHNRKPVGFISAHSSWEDWAEGMIGEIHELVVDKEFQGKSIGKELIERALLYLKEQGSEKVGLWVGVENKKAIQFYQSLGFIPHGKWGKWERMLLYL